MKTPQDVLAFWLDEVGPKGWYARGDALDAEIRDRFGPTLDLARAGSLGLWLTCASETLAYIILTDQFSRNIYRGKPEAFETDQAACAAAKVAIAKDWDFKIDGMARQFFYMPLMHSENLFDQDRAMRVICSRMPDGGAEHLAHAKAHREIIRKFGRFPFRNEALGRKTTAAEQDFLDNGGYGGILRAMQDTAA